MANPHQATVGQVVRIDPGLAAWTINAPVDPLHNDRFTVKNMTDSDAVVTLNAGAAQFDDPLYANPKATSIQVVIPSTGIEWVYDADNNIWMAASDIGGAVAAAGLAIAEVISTTQVRLTRQVTEGEYLVLTPGGANTELRQAYTVTGKVVTFGQPTIKTHAAGDAVAVVDGTLVNVTWYGYTNDIGVTLNRAFRDCENYARPFPGFGIPAGLRFMIPPGGYEWRTKADLPHWQPTPVPVADPEDPDPAIQRLRVTISAYQTDIWIRTAGFTCLDYDVRDTADGRGDTNRWNQFTIEGFLVHGDLQAGAKFVRIVGGVQHHIHSNNISRFREGSAIELRRTLMSVVENNWFEVTESDTNGIGILTGIDPVTMATGNTTTRIRNNRFYSDNPGYIGISLQSVGNVVEDCVFEGFRNCYCVEIQGSNTTIQDNTIRNLYVECDCLYVVKCQQADGRFVIDGLIRAGDVGNSGGKLGGIVDYTGAANFQPLMSVIRDVNDINQQFGFAVWDVGRTYEAGHRCLDPGDNGIYECTADGTVGGNPPATNGNFVLLHANAGTGVPLFRSTDGAASVDTAFSFQRLHGIDVNDIRDGTVWDSGQAPVLSTYTGFSDLIANGWLKGAWAAIEGQGTSNPLLLDSYNISSVVRVSTGRYRFTFQQTTFYGIDINNEMVVPTPGWSIAEDLVRASEVFIVKFDTTGPAGTFDLTVLVAFLGAGNKFDTEPYDIVAGDTISVPIHVDLNNRKTLPPADSPTI